MEDSHLKLEKAIKISENCQTRRKYDCKWWRKDKIILIGPGYQTTTSEKYAGTKQNWRVQIPQMRVILQEAAWKAKQGVEENATINSTPPIWTEVSHL